MAGLVGVILVAMALFSVVAVLYMVLREHQETEEHYIPPQAGSSPPKLDDEENRQVEENG